MTRVLQQNQIGCPVNCWTYSYYCRMMADIESGSCPFCNVDPQFNPTLRETTDCRIIKNAIYTENETQYQPMLIMPKRHVRNIEKLTADEFLQIQELLRWAKDTYEIVGGALLVRFGDFSFPALNTGTLAHLHINILRPKGKKLMTQVVGKSEQDIALAESRMKVFEKMRQGTIFDNLMYDEQELVKNNL